MAHQQQIEFCLCVKSKFPSYFSNKLVIDIGSLDINGNNQYLFDNCLYIGIDLLVGKNVDIAVKGHELCLPDNSVDVVISTECFEHDQFYDLTLKNIVRMLKPGGLFLFTCATSGRPEHGTRRTTPQDAPFINMFGEWGDYYKNLEEADIRRALNIEETFNEHAFSTNSSTYDLYFWGIKKGSLNERNDYSFQIKDSAHPEGLIVPDKNTKEAIKQNYPEQALISQIAFLSEKTHKRENEISDLTHQVIHQTQEIDRLSKAYAGQEEIVHSLKQTLLERDKDINGLNNKLVAYKGEISRLTQLLGEREMQIKRLTSSLSWAATKPLRFFARLLRGEVNLAASLLRKKYASRLRAVVYKAYHWLPLSAWLKLRLRERMHPLVAALRKPANPKGLGRAVVEVVCGNTSSSALNRDCGGEMALSRILDELHKHSIKYGPNSHWIALPFLSTGGAEMVALNFCKAIRKVKPGHSIVLIITDRNLISEYAILPEGVALIVLDKYLTGDCSYERKQSLLRDLLLATRPQCFHNINSEVAWRLILSQGERLKQLVSIYASIFAFQFSPDGVTKIGYAAYFLKQGMPHLSGLISDNMRFINDASKEYEFDESIRSRMHVIYQPCRLFYPNDCVKIVSTNLLNSPNKRLRILWAGRLDAEKRIDLLLDVVKNCSFADFHLFGQIVLDGDAHLPALPNLKFEGPFASPLQWIEQYRFDAFIFTSKWEGLPNILIEAGALAIPIVAPIVGGVGELITKNTGYPLPERPLTEDYIVALKEIEKFPDDANMRAQRLRELISHRHSWPAFVASIAALPGYIAGNLWSNSDEKMAYGTASHRDEMPLVSVIVPCYNQGRYLYECIASILVACHHDMEIIVVDDGSTDVKIHQYLAEVIKLAPHKIRIHRQENQGLSGARNSGVQLARGEFLQFIDADDLLIPGKIDIQLAQLLGHPWLDISICNFLLCDEERNLYTKPDEAIARFNFTLTEFLYNWERGFAIPIHCGLFRRRIFAGLSFDTSMRAKEDWLFWTSVALKGAHFGYVHGHWAIYRQHQNSMRRSFMKMGRAWLHAGLKIDAMLEGREPLFLESVLDWFDQCYRARPPYKEEMAQLQEAAHTPSLTPTEEARLNPSKMSFPVSVNVENLIHRLNAVSTFAKSPMFTLVVPIYNHYSYLEECLQSIARQGNVTIEVICIDDASPDPRVTALMQSLKNRLDWFKIVILDENCGISATQNRAVECAAGEYIAFLDCDDVLEPNALSVIRDYVIEHPDVDYFFTDRYEIEADGKLIRIARYGGYDSLRFYGQENIRTDLLDGMVASHLKVIRRSSYINVGGCNPYLSGVQDWDLALRIAESGNLHYIAEPLYRHRIHHNSVTSSDRVAQFRKSNIVRRHFCEKWLRNESAIKNQEKRFKKEEFPIDLRVLKEYWTQGYQCVADVVGALTNSQTNFLREFNSYFDRIEWDDPTVPASLVGYLYDQLAVRHPINQCGASAANEMATVVSIKETTKFNPSA